MMICWARQSGKMAMLKNAVAEQEAAGEWVAIASKDGLRCSRCQRDVSAGPLVADEGRRDEGVCRGACMGTES